MNGIERETVSQRRKTGVEVPVLVDYPLKCPSFPSKRVLVALSQESLGNILSSGMVAECSLRNTGL